MKKVFIFFACILLLGIQAWAQPATVSYPFAVGTSNLCTGGTQEIHYYTYNGATNTIGNAAGGLVGPGVPQLRIGGAPNGTQRFTSNYSSVSFNPRDHNIYFFWTALSGTLAPGGIPRTYAWRWPVGTYPLNAAAKLDTLRSFPADILGVAFDNNGNGYSIEFTNPLPTVPVTYKPLLRSLNFVTGAIGGADTLNLTGGARIYQQGSGDVAMSPSGQMFFVVNNKLFTPNYLSYSGTGANLTCTYIDTVRTTGNFVGLTYGDGEAIAAFSGTVAGVACPFQQITLLTAANTPITKTGTVRSAADMASVVSGVGSAKRLVSVTPTATPNQYDVVYEILVKNYGNMDVTNLQVTDNLGSINGFLNVSNVSVTIPVNPNGYLVNPGYNGLFAFGGGLNLLSGTPTLPNYPAANSSFTIRISCRLSNIQSGVVYYNSAIATARDFNSNNLRDSSTNGNLPDLNSNDKPDDVGEGQPTPLLITVPALTPPCVTLVRVLYSQDFGAGTGLTATIPAAVLGAGVSAGTATSGYAGSTTPPLPIERYVITNNPFNADNSHFISTTDHTGNANGRMLVINADATNTIMYRASFTTATCANSQYSLSFYAAFPGSASYSTVCDGFGGFRYPRIRMRIRDLVSNLIITEASTTDIVSGGWQQFGLKFTAPASYTQLAIELVNDAPGGCGNDILIDDIQFGSCDPVPTVSSSVTSGCIGSPADFTSTLTDPGAIGGTIEYQWEVGPTATGPWVAITGATAATYNIPSVTAGDVGRYYRVLIAASGNIGNVNCRFASAGILLVSSTPSVAPTSAIVNKTTVCPGIAITLSQLGGSLGTGAVYRWYSASCGGTLVGTGPTLNITAPGTTTTYYVRAEGLCNITACRSVTVFVTCDIDKDNDGIPDYVESYTFPAALTNAFNVAYPGYKDNNHDFVNDDFQADGDSDNDGIPNYLDTSFPGRIDSNGDGIDDRFDMDLDGVINMLDLDSDNDGIPDVVEAGGVDANGDGRIDNYTDTDGDGLSQNVDGNNTGAANSGNGLGAVNLDNDAYPNAIDRDSDGDGIPDVVEVYGPDANNNAIIDGFVDANGDGLHDSYINATALLQTGADTNNDGRADSYPNKNFDNDRRPNAYDLDSDGDGITDVLEAGFSDALDYNGFIDGPISTDGWNTALHAWPVLVLLNSDGIGRPNYLDIDSDGDGIPDNIEGQTTLGYRFPTYLDTDNDGLDNAYDVAPWVGAFGGAGLFPPDKDGDGIPDYIDLDTDSDGAMDITEGHDYNGNGIADENVTPTGIDTDGDGLDDRFDLINSTTNVRGTSGFMGTGGSLTGDVTPGTRATVQKFVASQPERDWRYVTYVLPVQYLHLTASESKNNVNLNWGVMASIALQSFEIQRSTDNVLFKTIATQSAGNLVNERKNYTQYDDIVSLNSEQVFYRIRVIAANGQEKYSNVAVVRKANGRSPVVISPNPAQQTASLRFYAEQESVVTLSIKDVTGRVVATQKAKVFKGNNSLPLNGLSQYSDGVYHVQMMIGNDVFTTKLIIQN